MAGIIPTIEPQYWIFQSFLSNRKAIFVLYHRLNDLPSPIIYNKFVELYFGERCIMKVADLEKIIELSEYNESGRHRLAND